MRAPNAIYHHDETVFSQWDERSAYLIGYLEADGYITYTKQSVRVHFQLSYKDLAYLEQLRTLVGYTGPIRTSDIHISGRTYQMSRFVVISRLWKTHLEQAALRCRQIPDMPRDLLHHYIRGYFDGDGSIYWETQSQNYKSNIVFSSQELGEEFARQLRPITNCKMIIHQKTSSSKCWYFSLASRGTARLCEYMYEDASVYLQRKFNLARVLLSTRNQGGNGVTLHNR